MDLGRRTRCIFITCAILIKVFQTNCELRNSNGSPSQKFDLNTPTLYDAYSSHRVLFVTSLGTLSLMLLGCLGCLCCCCCRSSQNKAVSLDAYAPRTQSIVWPRLPEVTAHVLELTFLHTPGAVDCLCAGCLQARTVFCIENCLDSTEC